MAEFYRQPGCLEMGVAVGQGEQAVGYVDPLRVAEVPENQWGTLTLGDVMIEGGDLAQVAPDEPLESLFRLFAMGSMPAALVVQDGRWVGTAGRSALMAYFQRLQALE